MTQSGKPQTLAAAQPGETISIRRFLFKGLRAHCTALGLREGDLIRCRLGTSSRMLIDNTRGRTVLLDRDLARFIEVGSTDGA